MKKEELDYSTKNLKNNPDYALPIITIKPICNIFKKNIIIPITIKSAVSDSLAAQEVTK